MQISNAIKCFFFLLWSSIDSCIHKCKFPPVLFSHGCRSSDTEQNASWQVGPRLFNVLARPSLCHHWGLNLRARMEETNSVCLAKWLPSALTLYHQTPPFMTLKAILTSDPKTHGSYHTVGFSSPIFTEEVATCKDRGHCSDERSGRGEELASPPSPLCRIIRWTPAETVAGIGIDLTRSYAHMYLWIRACFVSSGLGVGVWAWQLMGLLGENRSFERRYQATCCFNSPPADSASSFKYPLLSFWLFLTDIGCLLNPF